MSLIGQRPEPSRLWIRHILRPWPGPAGVWTDLATGGLGQPGEVEPSKVSVEAASGAEDVVYLPPADREIRGAREDLIRTLSDRGVPVVLQLFPGEDSIEGSEVVSVFDLLPSLLAGRLDDLSDLPESTTALWPLIGGLTDSPILWKAGLERLSRAGVLCVRGLSLSLAPGERRRLAEFGDDDAFAKLFHGPAPNEQRFAVEANILGLKPFIDRPVPSGPPSLVRNRRLAGHLALIGELWVRLGRAESQGQAFFRAARLIDESEHDLIVLCREGNLGVVSWLDPPSRELVSEVVERGGSSLLEQLESEYLSNESGNPRH